ncbi:SDR family oxidoreductase [Mangrovicoccus sp. HB161399]|uniref:SDR family oxidoreductase n=1 Tax=Mangrovicoccus sp. HB161399 TaxID=2720392 RepID=UPI001556C43D|nr:SDR family oxidoreductase [Mangrovicoccus sp. HB161399]
MIAVTAATGQLGRILVAKLKEKGATDLLALVRSPAKAADLGIPAKAFDYDAPDASALAGVDTLMLISGSEIGQRERQHKAVIAAAKEAGVGHIVYTSLLHAGTSTLSLAPEHVATEAALKDSGIAFTILRNGWYTENYLASVPSALQHGAFAGAAGDGRISSATREDYAEAAAAVLTGGGHEGKTYELSGDASYTLADLAAALSAQAGKQIPYADMSVEDYAGVLEGAGFPAPVAAAYAGFDGEAAKGALFDDGHTLSTLIHRPTTSLADALKAALAPVAA